MVKTCQYCSQLCHSLLTLCVLLLRLMVYIYWQSAVPLFMVLDTQMELRCSSLGTIPHSFVCEEEEFSACWSAIRGLTLNIILYIALPFVCWAKSLLV